MSRRPPSAAISTRSTASASPSSASRPARRGRWRWSSTSIRRWRGIPKTTISTPLRSPTRSTRCVRRGPAWRMAQLRRRPGGRYRNHWGTGPRRRRDRAETENKTTADAHVKHDYHLVDPSPWPAVGATSAFILAVGLIASMHHTFRAAPYLFGVGAIGLIYTMLSWWRDVVNEA